MKCNKCKYVEMKMYKVIEENKMIFKCKQCGNEEMIDMTEIEKTAKNKLNKFLC